jgi:fumarate reductase (cytochrome)
MLLLPVLALTIALQPARAPSVYAQTDATLPRHDRSYLADAHAEKKIACVSCHGNQPRLDDSETAINRKCVTCHGPLDDIAVGNKGHINAHRSHLGEINCTTCHHGHAAPEVYCNNCHAFALAIPGNTPGERRNTEDRPSVAFQIFSSELQPQQTDVVVIGSGAAGFAAAITAHDLGAQVILLEKQPITGGNSILASGGMNAAETRFQKARGIKDSVELMYQDTMKSGRNLNDPELVKVLARNSAKSVEWLTAMGVDMSDVGRLAGASVSRAHRPSGGSAIGPRLITVLRKNAIERNIDVRVNSKVVDILKDKQGRVTGVRILGKHSGLYTIAAKTVIDTAGGFSANPLKVAFYRPELAGMVSSNQPGATGDGVDLGSFIGGTLRDMKEIQIHPTIAAGSRILITEAVRGNGAILVNREGKRFVNELATRDVVSAAILAQTGKTAFLVFDEGVRTSLKQIEGYFTLGLVQAADTLRELAAKISVPADALDATITNYNRKSAAEFNRPGPPVPLRTPKYYAIEVRPGIHYTMGGLKINKYAQVIGKAGVPIPRFFAAGEVTGGVDGENRLGGNPISEAITFGRIAGENAVILVNVRPVKKRNKAVKSLERLRMP